MPHIAWAFSRTSTPLPPPSRPSVNPSVPVILRTSSWGFPSQALYSLWIVRDGWVGELGADMVPPPPPPPCARAPVGVGIVLCIVSCLRGRGERIPHGRPRVGVIDCP